MSNLLDDYEKQYSVLIAEITSQIAQIKLLGVGELRDKVGKVNANIDEAKELLEQIGLEIRDAPPQSRGNLVSRHQCHQAELKRLQEDFVRQQRTAQEDGPSLEEEMDEVGIRDQSKQRLLDNSERLERTGKHLNEGYKIVIETEQMANQTLRDLSDQRETIQKTRSRLRDTDADLHRSSRIMNSMIMRSIRERAILYGTGLIFIVILCVSIYLSFR